jgi:hypothetical protein
MPENAANNDDVDKWLKKFDRELDIYLAIKQKIETTSSIQNETARNEDRALQTRFAHLRMSL